MQAERRTAQWATATCGWPSPASCCSHSQRIGQRRRCSKRLETSEKRRPAETITHRFNLRAMQLASPQAPDVSMLKPRKHAPGRRGDEKRPRAFPCMQSALELCTDAHRCLTSRRAIHRQTLRTTQQNREHATTQGLGLVALYLELPLTEDALSCFAHNCKLCSCCLSLSLSRSTSLPHKPTWS